MAKCISVSESEGPFRRFVVWTQGCSIRCPGCCNPELFDPTGGQVFSPTELLEDIRNSQKNNGIEGVTFVGGEPLDQARALLPVVVGLRSLGLGVVLFSGYTFDQAQRFPEWSELWPMIDTLVDGPFLAKQLEQQNSKAPNKRAFIGSSNQRLHHRSKRYADPHLWNRNNTAEIQIDANGEISIHGFPDELVKAHRLLR